MNSEIYLALKRVDHQKAWFKHYAFEAEEAYLDLQETIQKHQVSQPDTLEKYCRTALFQISIEQNRIEDLLRYFDNSEPLTGEYYEEQRHFLTKILNFALDAKASIVEYLSVYRPELFKGQKADLIKELPAFNQFRQLFEELNESKPPKAIQSAPRIYFSSETEKLKVLELLKPYFSGQETKLSGLFENDIQAEALIFSGSARQFVEFFRRLKYNDAILNTKNELKLWLSANFYFSEKGVSKPLKLETIEQYLYKDKGELARGKRIGSEFYPYLNHQQQQDLKDKEK